MINYVCTQCGMRYAADETIRHYDFLHGELYVICPDCRSECIPEEDEEYEEESEEKEEREEDDQESQEESNEEITAGK